MRRRDIIRLLGVTVTLSFVVAAQLLANQTEADWIYDYFDDFATPKAEQDSYIHSVFWPQGAFPPAEPYLYYCGRADGRGLGFADFRGQPAYLGYCFPIVRSQAVRAVRGVLEIDVRFLSETEIWQSGRGYLLYYVSEDGVDWSIPKALNLGGNTIQIGSLQGTCYVIFLGTGIVVKI